MKARWARRGSPHRIARLAPAVLSCGLALFAGGTSTASAEEGRPGIIGQDDRVLLSETGPPWDAVGQVNIGGFRTSGQCTGTLVAPGVVITAAHCLVNAATGRPFPLDDIHFLAAVRGSAYKGHSTARCIRFLSGEDEDGDQIAVGNRLSDLAKDAAAIVLNDDVAVGPAPLAEEVVAAAGLRLAHVAYPGDRRFAPVIHRGCQLLGSDPEGRFWLNDCDTLPGSSGGPVFVEKNGVYKVAAIQVAAGSGANFALPLEAWADLIGDGSCP